jgi:nitrate reductase gamma subunit
MAESLNYLVFGWYPYLCLGVFVIGSILRFEHAQYSWRSGSSQILRKKQLQIGSNLFHFGVLFLFFGHLFGLLTPTALYTMFITVEQKQMLAIVAGGVAGTACFIGLSMLVHRRLFDARVRRTSSFNDTAILLILWVQLTVGLITIPLSLEHPDGEVMLRLSHWAQGIVTLQPEAAKEVLGLPWPYQFHLILGMTIFLLTPFSRLVHVFSAPVWYLGRRGYQLVRTRKRVAPAE